MPHLIETFDEFVERHGGDMVAVDDSTIAFPDGATCSKFDRSQRADPPEDDIGRLKARRRYVDAKRRRADSEFVELRASLVEQCSNAFSYRNLPAPGDHDLAEVERRRQVALEWRARLAEVDTRIEELKAHTPEEIRRREIEAEVTERRREIARLRQELMNSRLDESDVPEAPEDRAERAAVANAVAEKVAQENAMLEAMLRQARR